MALRLALLLSAAVAAAGGGGSGMDAVPGAVQLTEKTLRRAARRASNSTGALVVRYYLNG
jgi:acetyl/propionyl-CoA carboxylase alpha subunit